MPETNQEAKNIAVHITCVVIAILSSFECGRSNPAITFCVMCSVIAVECRAFDVIHACMTALLLALMYTAACHDTRNMITWMVTFTMLALNMGLVCLYVRELEHTYEQIAVYAMTLLVTAAIGIVGIKTMIDLALTVGTGIPIDIKTSILRNIGLAGLAIASMSAAYPVAALLGGLLDDPKIT